MVDSEMTWERWRSLTPDQREWEHFTYHQELKKRLELIEGDRWKRTVSQVAGAFVGGVMFWATIFMFFKDFLPCR